MTRQSALEDFLCEPLAVSAPAATIKTGSTTDDILIS
jgi:hypothetical protein